jgi:hypothetical protein
MVFEKTVTDMTALLPRNGNHDRPDISDLMTQQLQMMNEIIFRQLQILQSR